jgi:hypothetical protein
MDDKDYDPKPAMDDMLARLGPTATAMSLLVDAGRCLRTYAPTSEALAKIKAKITEPGEIWYWLGRAHMTLVGHISLDTGLMKEISYVLTLWTCRYGFGHNKCEAGPVKWRDEHGDGYCQVCHDSFRVGTVSA